MLATGLVTLAAVAAYHNSFWGPFVYDDLRAIAENRSIRRLWPIGPVLSPPPSGVTVAGRPLLNLSLAINYALSGLDVAGYHAANLLIHIAAALLLFGILRRTLLLPALRERFDGAATPLALAGALLWTVHPLQTESVTYIVQRAESLAGFFYLLTLYCTIRGAGTVTDEGRGTRGEGRGTGGEVRIQPTAIGGEKGDCPPRRYSRLWYVAALSACLLGMACKEVVVTAPLVVLLYDRTFLAGSVQQAWRRRWAFYLGLAATWALLAHLVLSAGLIGRRPEMGAPDWSSYARSQPAVILHYLRLAVWPSGLCLHYDWPVSHDLAEILPGAMAVALLLAATAWGLMNREAYGFLGAWFLLILAPTSSILPLGQLAADHRMYLPLAAVATLAITGGYVGWARLRSRSAGPATIMRWAAPVAALAGVLVTLGYATTRRNADYQSPLAIWQDTVEKDPQNAFAHTNFAVALNAAGKPDKAIEHFREALRLKPQLAETHANLGIVLANLGKFDEAMQHYQQALRLKPDFAEAHNALADALAAQGRSDEAIEHYRHALRLEPDHAEAHNALADALAGGGRTAEAIGHYRHALRLEPDHAEAHNNLGVALLKSGETEEAMQHFDQALRIRPDFVEAHNNLGHALTAAGRTAEAIQHCQRALQLNPDYALAHCNLANALAASGRTSEAIEHYRHALRLKPDFAEAQDNLSKLLQEKQRRH